MLHVVQWTVASTAVFIAQTMPDVASGDWIVVVERLGLSIALVLFFVYTGYQREARMAKRIDALERYNNNMASKLATLEEQGNTAMHRVSETLASALQVLSARPCYACQRDEFDAWLVERRKS